MHNTCSLSCFWQLLVFFSMRGWDIVVFLRESLFILCHNMSQWSEESQLIKDTSYETFTVCDIVSFSNVLRDHDDHVNHFRLDDCTRP